MESIDPRKSQNPVDDFIDHAVWYGEIGFSNELLAIHPEIKTRNIYSAAILGDADTVNKYLLSDPSLATKKGGPRNWDALTYLCFSKYLRIERSRSDDFVAVAKALLGAGADINTGFFDKGHLPNPEWESLLYGAAGVAFHPAMTELLLAYGADPNDNEVPYHSPETYDNAALEILVNSGKLTADSLATMLLRKADLHDLAGMEILLKAAADPNRLTMWKFTALHQAIRRDNHQDHIQLLLNYGADPNLPDNVDGYTGIEIAARRGRSDLLNLFTSRGISLNLEGENLLLAACALNDQAAILQIREREQELITGLLSQDGSRLAEFAGNGNTAGVKCLFDLGIKVNALYTSGDGYFGIAGNSSALLVAAWKMRTETVRLLLEKGADVHLKDNRGRTALDMAVLACTDSYWMERRSPHIIRLLLDAGASAKQIKLPTGYDEIDLLLSRAQ